MTILIFYKKLKDDNKSSFVECKISLLKLLLISEISDIIYLFKINYNIINILEEYKMKKIVVLVLSICMLFLMVVCGNYNQVPDKTILPSINPTVEPTKYFDFVAPELDFVEKTKDGEIQVLYLYYKKNGELYIENKGGLVNIEEKTFTNISGLHNNDVITKSFEAYEHLEKNRKEYIGLLIYNYSPYFIYKKGNEIYVHYMVDLTFTYVYEDFCHKVYDYAVSNAHPTGGFGLGYDGLDGH